MCALCLANTIPLLSSWGRLLLFFIGDEKLECAYKIALSWSTRWVTLFFLVVLSLLVVVPPASAEVSAEPDNTPQTDGIVFSVLPVGNHIYIGGDFTHVDGLPRERLAAIDTTTGELTDWNPGANKSALPRSPLLGIPVNRAKKRQSCCCFIVYPDLNVSFGSSRVYIK